MPSTLFDSAGLAVVAYAQVNGATGASENTSNLANSGIYTTRLQLGQYLVQISTALGQIPSRDLIFVQPARLTGYTNPAYPPGSLVTDANAYNKIVEFGTLDPVSGLTTALDCDFSILILRTILP
jgi:hypothetical protein